MLFGGPVKSRRAEDFPKTPPAPKPRRARAAKSSAGAAASSARATISAPSYYSYKPDALVTIDFSSLAPLARTVSLEPNLDPGAFREAVAALEGFELVAEAEIGKAVAAHYAANPAFIWVSGSSANSRATEALRVLAAAGDYGLDPADYVVAAPSAGFALEDTRGRWGELIHFEMALSARVLRYVRDASAGRIDPNRMSGYYDFPKKPFDAEAVLRELAGGFATRAYLEARHPQNPEYKALKAELAVLQASTENDIVVDPKLLLKPGQTSPELPKLLTLIARGLEAGDIDHALLSRLGSSDVYVDALVPVVKAAQEKAGLKPDGVIGPRTVAALAGTSKAERIQKVTAALEALRWHPSDLGSPRVFINQPAFTASYIENGAEVLKMRAVVGKTSNQTSFFYDEIEQVDYNPYWGVPQSIIVNEMLPRLRRDPGYLDRAGYEVTDAKGRRIPSSAVDWWQYGSKVPFGIRQAPSEANALGELKILFPNKHAIYMHDTPAKDLFDRDSRAFSHGCVRLHDPRGMAAAVLGTDLDHIAAKIAEGHSSEKVTRKIPVYVAYFTAWPDASGKVEYFADVYERDARLKDAIDKTEAVRTGGA